MTVHAPASTHTPCRNAGRILTLTEGDAPSFRPIFEKNVMAGGTNKLQYNLSVEDLVALSSFQLLSSGLYPRRLRQARFWTFSLGTVPLLVAGYFLIEYQSWIAGLAAACYVPLVAFDFVGFDKRFKRTYTRFNEKRFRAILSERHARDGRSLGEHTVEIEGDWMVGRSRLGEGRCLVRDTELNEFGEYSFVFLGAEVFCILSEKQIMAGDFEAFLNELKGRTAAPR